jgi:hypothetical protein
MSTPHTVDLRDGADREAWLRDLRSSLDDIDGVVRDMLREPGERELGPVYHREIYGEAWTRVTALLEMVDRGDGGAGPPTGSG